jgi:GDP-L-fucose synthase
MLKKTDKILIAGQEGMVGSAVYRLLKKNKYKIIECKRNDLNFLDQNKVTSWFKKNKPNIVINACGKVGGIIDNLKFLEKYLYENTMIGLNLVKASHLNNVDIFINLGSACVYPKKTKQPIKEEYLLSSFLEPTNEGYALAKIITMKYCQYISDKFKKKFLTLQPANLYGENDNFDDKSSHVIASLLKKFHYAKIKNKKTVEVWGSGNVRREFLNVDDLASAILFCIKKRIKHKIINVGSGEDISIKKLAIKFKELTNFKGKIIFNRKYPDGVKVRKLDFRKLHNKGWKPKITLDKGIIKYYQYYKQINKN